MSCLLWKKKNLGHRPQNFKVFGNQSLQNVGNSLSLCVHKIILHIFLISHQIRSLLNITCSGSFFNESQETTSNELAQTLNQINKFLAISYYNKRPKLTNNFNIALTSPSSTANQQNHFDRMFPPLYCIPPICKQMKDVSVASIHKPFLASKKASIACSKHII